MAPRAHWKGFLKLSLVSCPIALYPAISPAERVSFRQVNRQTGNRLRHQLVDSVTGEAVEASNRGRGYEIGENRFLLVEDEELEAARNAPRDAWEEAPTASPIQARSGPPPVETARRGTPVPPAPPLGPTARGRAPVAPEPPPPVPLPPRPVNNRTIEIEKFVPRVQIHPRYYDKAYYVVPRDQVGQEAFAVIREAMREEGMVGIGRVVLSARERPIALEPMGQGLCGITLHYRNEVRAENEYFADIPKLELPDEMLEVAKHILETKASSFDPSMLEDHYQNTLVQMLKEKKAELPEQILPAKPSSQNVVSLMDVLKRSLAAERPSGAKSPPSRAAKIAKAATKRPGSLSKKSRP
jgi:DNA end-binding protein Ku